MEREKIDNLIAHLKAIRGYAKDIHYNCSGPNFYGNHEFADRFTENIEEYIDQLKEICLLGHNFKPLHSDIYDRMSADIIPAGADFKLMRTLMVDTLVIIEELRDLSRGDENLVGAIAQDVQNNVGLINIMYGDMS